MLLTEVPGSSFLPWVCVISVQIVWVYYNWGNWERWSQRSLLAHKIGQQVEGKLRRQGWAVFGNCWSWGKSNRNSLDTSVFNMIANFHTEKFVGFLWLGFGGRWVMSLFESLCSFLSFLLWVFLDPDRWYSFSEDSALLVAWLFSLYGSFSCTCSSEKPFFLPCCSTFQLHMGQFCFDSWVPQCRRQVVYDPAVLGSVSGMVE